jgi:hypothetical protein
MNLASARHGRCVAVAGLAMAQVVGCGADPEPPGPSYIAPFVGQTAVDVATPLLVRGAGAVLPPDYAMAEAIRVVALPGGGFIDGDVVSDGDDLTFVADGGWVDGQRYAWTVDPLIGVPHGPELGIADGVEGTGVFTAGDDPTVLDVGLTEDQACLLLSQDWDSAPLQISVNDVAFDEVDVDLIPRVPATSADDWRSQLAGDVICLNLPVPVSTGAAIRVTWGDHGPWRFVVSGLDPRRTVCTALSRDLRGVRMIGLFLSLAYAAPEGDSSATSGASAPAETPPPAPAEAPATPATPPPATVPAAPAALGVPIAPPVTGVSADEPDDDFAGGNVPSGYRIAAPGAGASVALAQGVVVGRAGGTNVTTIIGRYAQDRFSFSVGLPFAAYRTPEARQAELGNLQLDGYYALTPGGDWEHYVGLETHFRVGARAYSYMTKPDEIWPGFGVDAAYEGRKQLDGLTLMVRGSLGIHTAAGFDPFPSLYARVGGAFGVDKAIGDRMGIVGEAAIQTWDTSPFEITALFRGDPIEGLRLRGGFVLPVATWAGLIPANQAAGLSEVTFLADASLAF